MYIYFTVILKVKKSLYDIRLQFSYVLVFWKRQMT